MSLSISHHRVPVSEVISLHAQFCSHERELTSALVIFSHGFITLGTENHGIFVRASRALQSDQIGTVLFDHIGCGYSDGDYMDFRLAEAARHLNSVKNWARSKIDCSCPVFYWAQSLGTAVAALAYLDEPEGISGMVMWNLSDEIYDRYQRIFGASIVSQDRFCVSHKGYVVSRNFLSECREVCVSDIFRSVKCPTLFLHCGGDAITERAYAERAVHLNAELFEFVEIESANHSFYCQRELEQVAIEKSTKWILANLHKVTRG